MTSHPEHVAEMARLGDPNAMATEELYTAGMELTSDTHWCASCDEMRIPLSQEICSTCENRTPDEWIYQRSRDCKYWSDISESEARQLLRTVGFHHDAPDIGSMKCGNYHVRKVAAATHQEA